MVVEAQQLELDFNRPISAAKIEQDKPDKKLTKWMVACATKKVTALALARRYENILNMSHSQRKRFAFDCFMYAIKRRLRDIGFNSIYAMTEQGLPEYIAASGRYFINKKCKEIKWH